MDFVSYVQKVMQPMEPEDTGWSPVFSRPESVKVVLFDIYGTLLQSAAGDISLVSEDSSMEGMAIAKRGLGMPEREGEESWIVSYEEGIKEQHRLLIETGMDFPEVEIRAVWRSMTGSLMEETPSEEALEMAALSYECAVNPTWLMPGAREMVDGLLERGFVLGLISNAQFYTHPVLEAALGLDESIFREELCLFSYREKCAKPAARLFETMKSRLKERGVSPEEVIYFGNDLRKDILPARNCGFRTGLFAGDQRSLRVGDRSVSEVEALCDVILTDWSQWPQVL